MSKSLGNVVSPEDIIKKSGVDILRLWVATTDYTEDMRISDEILSNLNDNYRRIRNTFRFILGNIQDNLEDQSLDAIEFENFNELEKYILHKIFILDVSIKENLKNYNFHKMYKELLNFCTLDLSSFYFDIRKDVLYCDSINSKKRKECIIVLNIILNCLLRWFAPILVFTTDEIYNLVGKKNKSIHELQLPSIPAKWENKKLNEKWKSLYNIKQEVNIAIEAKRASKEIGSSLEAELKITTNITNHKLLEGLDLSEYFITSKAEKFKSQNEQDLKIEVLKAKGDKCPRCWKILETVCNRCEATKKENI
jgi:isoleucyl-tRNA synthetase